jgi:hypothetical protein
MLRAFRLEGMRTQSVDLDNQLQTRTTDPVLRELDHGEEIYRKKLIPSSGRYKK